MTLMTPGTLTVPRAATAADLFSLLKPRVMSLVIFTGFAGMISAPSAQPLSGLTMVWTLLFMALGAGAAGALNMWYEVDTDALMQRTAQRPLPAGRLHPRTALILGLLLGSLAIIGMGLTVNPLAAALLALTIAFYVVVYTIWLKPRTPQNIVIGGAAGALPPVIGWSAVTETIEPGALALFFIIFLWTPPHFWSLALCRTDDYARAGLPMLPVVAGTAKTCRLILLYTIALLGASLLPPLLGHAGLLYTTVALCGGTLFLLNALALNRSTQDDLKAQANKMFRASIFYLFALFLALPLERIAT